MEKEIESEHHFICKGGCRGISEKSGVCGAKSCSKEGRPLEECMCPDGRHGGAFEEVEESAKE